MYSERAATASINFITSHDGFTLADLVSYNEKHNEANGENNRDGANDNYSWNCGVEGPTNDPQINELRNRQVKNALAMLFLSQGVPMLLMGDECGRTKEGNNNTYCHDGPLTWFDWSLPKQNAELFRFCQHIIQFRRRHPMLRNGRHGVSHADTPQFEVIWHGTKPYAADWSIGSRVLACEMRGELDNSLDVIYVAMNMYWESIPFQLPDPPSGKSWYVAVNTAQPSPHDIYGAENERLVENNSIPLASRSVLVLLAK